VNNSKPVLYHCWSDTNSQRLRLALSYKQISYTDKPISRWDDEIFFELGVSLVFPILQMPDKSLLLNVNEILWEIDGIFPSDRMLVRNVIDEAAWNSLLEWREKVDAILTRLTAPALLNYIDIAESDDRVAAYKRHVQNAYNMSAEALANDRYAAYTQFAQLTNIVALGKHLTAKQFYMGAPSIADAVLTADLYPLQCLDGVSLPIDILYYLSRVEKEFDLDLQQGFKTKLN